MTRDGLLMRYARAILMCSVLLGVWLLSGGVVTAESRTYVGQVDEVNLPQRVLVTGGEQYRLDPAVRFTSEHGSRDMANLVRPGTHIRYVLTPAGDTIVALHVFDTPPE